MSIFSRIRSLFRKSQPDNGLVPFYDVPTKRVVRIPPAELRPGCIQIRLGDTGEVVWAIPEQLSEGPIRHPPFDEEMREFIRDIQQAFAEPHGMTFEEWEEGFRRDMNPAREIAIWSYAADVYRKFTENEPDAARRHEIFRLLVACMTTSPDTVWHVAKLEALDRLEAERIVRRF